MMDLLLSSAKYLLRYVYLPPLIHLPPFTYTYTWDLHSFFQRCLVLLRIL